MYNYIKNTPRRSKLTDPRDDGRLGRKKGKTTKFIVAHGKELIEEKKKDYILNKNCLKIKTIH